jgi:hypothetical protein
MSHLNLVNFLEDPTLNGLRFDMGARLVQSFGPRTQLRLLDEEAIRRLGVEGIDIDDFSEIKVEHDGTLSYKGKRIVIYIRDVKHYKDNQSLPKYHFSYCRTLETMRQNKRWHRYVVANRDDGTFVVNFVGDKTSSKAMKLAVCQNCLEHIAWENFSYAMSSSTKQSIVRGFALSAFFEKYPKDLLSVVPTYTVDTAPLNDYSDDWGMISEGLKKKRGYCCAACGITLSGTKRKYLHVHHINGQKNNNSEDNLEILCIKCHAEQPMHAHMKGLKDYQEYVGTP